MPAYNAERTLEQTFKEIPFDLVDEVVLVDDASRDNTAELAKSIGVHHVIKHDKNKGYGGNQKTCYKKALELGADIVIMLHPDYQYTPKLLTAMISLHFARPRGLSGGLCLTHSGAWCLDRWHALLQVCFQSYAYPYPKYPYTPETI